MKDKKIISPEEIENIDDCGVCILHQKAYEKMQKEMVYCPFCFKDQTYCADWKIVEETNSYHAEEKIKILPVKMCIYCNEYFSLMPTKIIYNSNHDIYYPGGKTFLTDDADLNQELKESILEPIEQYTQRLRAGEKIEPWSLAWWISSAIESAVAKYLYEKLNKK